MMVARGDQIFSHHTGRLSISVFKMDGHEASIAHAAAHSRYDSQSSHPAPRTGVRMWSYCKKCARVVTPVTLMEEGILSKTNQLIHASFIFLLSLEVPSENARMCRSFLFFTIF